MLFEDCYDIARYFNEYSKDCFSEREVATNAFELYLNIEDSKACNKFNSSLKETLKLLLMQFDDCTAVNYAYMLVQEVTKSTERCECVIKALNSFSEVRKSVIGLVNNIEDYEDMLGIDINDIDSLTDKYPFNAELLILPVKMSDWTHVCITGIIDTFLDSL